MATAAAHCLSAPADAASNSRAAAVALAPIASGSSFAATSGTNFVLDGQVFYPSGTNW